MDQLGAALLCLLTHPAIPCAAPDLLDVAQRRIDQCREVEFFNARMGPPHLGYTAVHFEIAASAHVKAAAYRPNVKPLSQESISFERPVQPPCRTTANPAHRDVVNGN